MFNLANIVSVCALILVVTLHATQDKSEKALNITNTVNPVLHMLIHDTCGYEGSSNDIIGQLISKREVTEQCIDGEMNAYYVQCLEPTKQEIRLDAFSCINEEDVTFPNEELYRGIFERSNN